jgi:hypothetical protein
VSGTHGALLTSEPSGRLVLPAFDDVLDRLAGVELRVAALERVLDLPLDQSAA